MKNHVKDFGSYIKEGADSQIPIGDGTWILYYWYEHTPHFISAHTFEKQAEAAWEDAIEDRFGDEIQGWMEENLPQSAESLDDLSPKAYDMLHREGVVWASDELAFDVEFSYDTLGDLKKRDDWGTDVFDDFRQEMGSTL